MALGRNVDDHFAKTPVPHFPRSRFDNGIHKRLQTQGHGRLYPFYIRFIYPGDTMQMEASAFVRMDTSLRVPLDDIYLDTYFFFVPLRILDENFPKILGEGEPSDYDDVSYGFPQLHINGDSESSASAGKYEINCLLNYLGYSQYGAFKVGNYYQYVSDDDICPYALAAYYKIYNDWFRDENVDASIPYKNLYGSQDTTIMSNDLFDNFNCLKVNRYHDYFAGGLIAPQKGPAVTIPLGTSAPVGVIADATGTAASSSDIVSFFSGSEIKDGKLVQAVSNGAGGVSGLSSSLPVIADLSQAAGTINELRLAFAIQALYERRGRFGTRYIETIRGQWGIEVPDSFFLRPEYLGGMRNTLNNVPVLSTNPYSDGGDGGNLAGLGKMSGNSATLGNCGSFTKTFIEYGFVIGLSCTRVKHSYTQGKRKEIWDYKTQLDLYNPVFANIGMQPVKMSEIVNDPDGVNGTSTDGLVFCYQEAWNDLRCDIDTFAGKFSIFSDDTDLQNNWHYGDYYVNLPSFSASWLKEDYRNVARTLTGQLIAGAAYDAEHEVEGHQFMFGYYFHPIMTRILPSHSIPAELLGRL